MSSAGTSRRALVTGAMGFAGRHLCAELLRRGARVYGLRHRRAVPDRPMPEVTWVSGDVLDLDTMTRLLTDLRPTEIYHLAAFARVGAAWTHRRQVFEVNLLGTVTLLDALLAAELRPAGVLIVGSSEQYGRISPADLPIREDVAQRPASPYGASKVCQEVAALNYASTTDLSIFVTRSFNHLGPGQNLGFVAADMASQIARIEAGLDQGPMRVGNLSARRDFTDVRDVVRAYVDIVEGGRPCRPYNVCSGVSRPVSAILEGLLDLAEKPIEVVPDPRRLRPSDTPEFVGDRGRLAAETGWSPRIPWERTLADVLADWRRRVRSP